jgi:hypothetical protein
MSSGCNFEQEGALTGKATDSGLLMQMIIGKIGVLGHPPPISTDQFYFLYTSPE